MKRLTTWYDGNQAICENEECSLSDCPFADPICEQVQSIIDRLAAYEDTGLEPEETSKIREDVENGYLKSTARRYGVSVDRLRELAGADRDGRCVVLPIKIPGWGWYCNSKFPNAISAYFDYPSQVVDCMEDYILRGTKEEAEAALATDC